MAKTVLLLGVRADLLEAVTRELQTPGIEFLGGTGVSDAESAFRQADIDHVIIGGGLDLEARAAMVRAVFQSSDRATVHMKDQMSGPEGFLPFVRAVLAGSAAMSLANRPTRSCGRGARTQALDNRVSAGGASQVRIQPFSVAVDAAVIGDMRARIRGTRLPAAAPGKRWAQGTDRDWLEGLLGYWADGFDWRAAEREMNRFAHYRAQIGDAAVHFVHERARHGGGIPLVLGHGWPSCFTELLPLVALLTDPGRHGIDGPAFDVVRPSLPGYGVSS